MPSNTSQRPSGSSRKGAANKSGSKPAAKGAGKSSSSRPAGRRGPVKPVKPGLPWGMIALGSVVVLVAAGLIGYGIWFSQDAGQPFGSRSSERIEGVKNFRLEDPEGKTVLSRTHKPGQLTYAANPPVGGDHNDRWQNCIGDVYPEQIANEHAVHSLEHGAVWITYRPDLPKDEVEALAKKVRNKDYMMMSPYPGLDAPISLQAWGFQLKVQSADDPRIDEFITVFRVNASLEPQASCAEGVTATGDKPQAPQGPPQVG
ncbi:MAG TPA: DUF3105 domain-containing protein [Cryptosporangiaceae bacterium]|nr:DUF3105 domain-containing protein [Cryptosporangiaceae bacterium]